MRALLFAWLVAAWAATGAVAACDRDPPEPSSLGATAGEKTRAPNGVPPVDTGVVIVAAPSDEAVQPIVRRALAKAIEENRALVVYVGAAWCEPCQRFHSAAARGELNGSLPPVTLLEFDLDRDRDRLASGGYISKYIPLFALPRTDGYASGRQVEGGIKGDGALGFIVPRLQALLAR